MKNLRLLDKYRIKHPFGNEVSAAEGAFILPDDLRVIACNGDGWDHVSVSREDRIPSWYDMELVKRMFFKDDETAMQLHLPPAKHINQHPNVLHLWRPHNVLIPLPPARMV
jgi:hypothetical protein